MTRKFWLVLVIGVIAIAAIIGSVLLTANRDNTYRIKRLPDYVTEKPSDFSRSSLNIYKNGTFDIEIIYENTTHFIGHGTYTKTKDAYICNYLEVYTNAGSYKNDLEIVKNKRIRFVLNGISYIFGR